MGRKMKKIILIAMVILGPARWLAADEPEQKFQGFNLQGYNANGDKAWNVNGDTADVVDSEIILSNVDADSYGEQNVNVKAKTGRVDQVSGKMHLEQDVVVTSEDGKKLLTDSLDWSRDKDLVTTEDDVVITDERMMASGKGMEAHPGLKTAKIKEDVSVLINTDPGKKKDSKKVTITSDGPMTIDQEKSVAFFEDNVVAVQEDKTLKADRMEIYFDKEMSGIKEMVCIGHVEIEQGKNHTFAEKAVYNGVGKKLTLSGRPKLILLTEGENLFAASGN